MGQGFHQRFLPSVGTCLWPSVSQCRRAFHARGIILSSISVPPVLSLCLWLQTLMESVWRNSLLPNTALLVADWRKYSSDVCDICVHGNMSVPARGVRGKRRLNACVCCCNNLFHRPRRRGCIQQRSTENVNDNTEISDTTFSDYRRQMLDNPHQWAIPINFFFLNAWLHALPMQIIPLRVNQLEVVRQSVQAIAAFHAG